MKICFGFLFRVMNFNFPLPLSHFLPHSQGLFLCWEDKQKDHASIKMSVIYEDAWKCILIEDPLSNWSATNPLLKKWDRLSYFQPCLQCQSVRPPLWNYKLWIVPQGMNPTASGDPFTFPISDHTCPSDQTDPSPAVPTHPPTCSLFLQSFSMYTGPSPLAPCHIVFCMTKSSTYYLIPVPMSMFH